ncbi:S-layer homology domain-containing protein ['Paenibacillus yunnanensis' Narsing Rao et al. 2020]|uniref:S-layer homology domain-containing protein n=1 Tax=Paenibacillus tengchongensis TaxID=2608684 RepID=UPI00124DA54D|nr:S-layer homology domain-containing protein [Paenibacillus tengchongensis]
MRKLLSCVLGIGLVVNADIALAEQSNMFKDVPNHFWGEDYIERAIEHKIVEGYPDGTFKPDAKVSQGEFLAMLIRSYQPLDFNSNQNFQDWVGPYLSYSNKLGWTELQPSEQAALNRGNVARYLVNATGKNFTVDDSIQYLLDIGIAKGKTERSIQGFMKNDPVTRTEALVFIERLKYRFDELESIPKTAEQYHSELAQKDVFAISEQHINIQFPQQWKSKYEVVYTANSELKTKSYDFIDKSNKSHGGVLFRMTVWPKEVWSSEGPELMKNIHIYKIGERDNVVFTINTPTDVQYSSEDLALKTEYLNLSNDVTEKRIDFLID